MELLHSNLLMTRAAGRVAWKSTAANNRRVLRFREIVLDRNESLHRLFRRYAVGVLDSTDLVNSDSNRRGAMKLGRLRIHRLV